MSPSPPLTHSPSNRAARPRRAASLLGLAVLVLASCGVDRGAKIASFEMEDMSAPAMFKELGVQLGRPYLLEIPITDITERYDLKVEHTDELGILEAICKLDGHWGFARDERRMLLWPVGRFAEAEESPYAAKRSSFRARGGAFTVLQELVAVSIDQPTTISCAQQGRHRMVELDVADASLREILAEVAAQANLSIVAEPGHIMVAALFERAEPRDDTSETSSTEPGGP